jgi:hypothetical protein
MAKITAVNTAPPAEKAPDPFDPANLRLSQDFIESAGVRKLLTSVPIRKPHRQDFIRVHPAKEYRDTFGMLPIGDGKDFYLVHPSMAGELVGEFYTWQVYTCLNRQGTLFLWPVRLPGPDGKINEWWRTAHEATEHAMKKWTRISANQNLGAYEVRLAESAIAEPEWPEHTFAELLRIAFRDRMINAPDHEVIRQLRGLA